MKISKAILLSSLLLPLMTTGLHAETVPVVWTPPSGMEPGPISGTEANFITHAKGVGVELSTTGLPAGHVVTVWFVAIQNPDKCSSRPCIPPEAMGKADVMNTVARNAGGGIVGPDGNFRIASFTPTGAVFGNLFNSTLDSPETAEIHMAIHDHGPLIADRAYEMTTTYRGSCTDKSVPPFYPDTARVDGTKGDYPCKVIQVGILMQ